MCKAWAEDPRKLPPAHVGPGLLRGPCSPGLRTAAKIKRQKTKRQEGAAFDAIFLLLLGGHRQSPRRRRGRRSQPRALAGRDAGGSGSPGHTTAPWAVALHLLVSAARNFSPRSAPTPLSSLSTLVLAPHGCSSRDRRPSLPGRHLSNSERCTWFFLAGLLFPFCWKNNNSGSGSACKKPGARKESSGMATGNSRSRRSPQVATAVAVIAAAGIAAAAAALPAALTRETGRRV